MYRSIVTCAIVLVIVHSVRDVSTTCTQRQFRPIYSQKCDTGEAEAQHNPTYRQCIYQCLHRGSKCASMSYNTVDELCTITETPCHELSAHPDVLTNVFHNMTHHLSQCLQWHPYDGTSPARSITYDQADGTIWLARWQDLQGNLLIGYMLKTRRQQVAYFEYIIETHLKSPYRGCDLITIADDCSVAWVKFTIGDPVPLNAAETGYIIGHGTVYVGRYLRTDKPTYRFGFYMRGDHFLTHPLGHVFAINTFDMMVIV